MEATKPAFRAIDRLFHTLAFVAGLILILMMLHVSADVAAKYVFRRPLPGTIEIISAYYMVFSVFLPLGLVEWSRKSITVDILYNAMPRSVKIAMITVVLASITVIYGALTFQTWKDALAGMARRDFMMGGVLEVPIWATRFGLPLGFGMACLVTGWQFLGVVLGFDRESWLVDDAPTDTDLE